MLKLARTCALSVMLGVAGCSPILQLNSAYRQPNLVGIPDAEQPYLTGNPTEMWGVSLSGGGLRSGLYSVGALKALYDIGLLPRVDAISAVSGGSYAAYWLYANQHQSGATLPIGATSLDDAKFGQRFCRLLMHANMIGWNRRSGYAVARGGARGIYADGIAWTFGEGDPDRTLDFNALRPTIGARLAPFLIVNASIRNKAPKDVIGASWPREVLEYTSAGMRSDRFAPPYAPWGEQSETLRGAVTISGAIYTPLYQSRDWPDPRERLKLSDGGHAENLGALALIRRGIANIVVIDAEMDQGSPLGAYVRLRDGLRASGLVLSIDEFENRTTKEGDKRRMEQSVHRGWVVDAKDPAKRIATIYYVKMSMPISILTSTEGWREGTGKDEWDGLRNRIAARGATSEKICPSLTLPQDRLTPMFGHVMRRYRQYIQTSVKARASRRIGGPLGDFVRIDFPRMTTFATSYKIDQAAAFVGLGYLQARELCTDPDIAQIACPAKAVSPVSTPPPA